MGYVRMIKAGGLHFVSNSIRFVPDLDDIPNFEELTLKEEVGGGAGNNKDTMASEAAKTLDEVVANLGKNFSDNTEYFQVCFFATKHLCYCVDPEMQMQTPALFCRLLPRKR